MLKFVSLVIAPLLNKGGHEEPQQTTEMTNEAVAPAADIKTLKGEYPVDVAHSFVSYSINHWMGKAHGSMPIDTGLIIMTGDPKAKVVGHHKGFGFQHASEVFATGREAAKEPRIFIAICRSVLM